METASEPLTQTPMVKIFPVPLTQMNMTPVQKSGRRHRRRDRKRGEEMKNRAENKKRWRGKGQTARWWMSRPRKSYIRSWEPADQTAAQDAGQGRAQGLPAGAHPGGAQGGQVREFDYLSISDIDIETLLHKGLRFISIFTHLVILGQGQKYFDTKFCIFRICF